MTKNLKRCQRKINCRKNVFPEKESRRKKEDFRTAEDKHKKSHGMKNKIDRDILSKHTGTSCSHHYSDLVRNLIRRLTIGGPPFF